MNRTNTISICLGLGNVLEVENIGELRLICQSYLRILVEIDATKPLKPGFFHARVGGIPT
jgi:hypothetical protein